MNWEKRYKGSSLEVEISLLEDDGTALNLTGVDEVLVLFAYTDGTSGTLQRFAKVAAGDDLAWTTPGNATGKVVCVVPAAVTAAAKAAKVNVEVKVKLPDGYHKVDVLGSGFQLLDAKLATE